MPEYCTAADLQNRLSVIGYEWVADRDASGTGVTSAEEAAYITPAIQYAGQLIDEAVSRFIEPGDARASGNLWLRNRATDIATVFALETGGRKVPDAMQARHDDAMERLQAVKDGETRVPSLTYAYPQDGRNRSTRIPQTRRLK